MSAPREPRGLAAPVGDEGQVLGAIMVDAAIAQIAPQAWGAQAPRVFS